MAGLEAAERRARPLEIAADVAFAPTPALTDLAARPKTSRRTLALSRWSQHEDRRRARDGEDGAASWRPPRSIWSPIPTRRTRSRCANARPAARSSRRRLPGCDRAPRPRGSPASWSAGACGASTPPGRCRSARSRSWPTSPASASTASSSRPRAGACRPGCVRPPTSGAGGRPPRSRATCSSARVTSCLPVDLATRGAAADLGDHDRVFEIWPPLDDIVDRDGRRLEAVVMLVEQPDADDVAGHARRSEAIRAAGAVPPPARAPGLAGWRTFKLFGAQGRQDDLLALLLPTVRAGQHAGEIDGWFFQRYIDGPGSRHHLRVRGHATGDAAAFAFEGRLRDRLRAARAAAIVTSIEVDEYRPELGRFRADELAAIHDIFESDSELVCALLPAPGRPARAHLPAGARAGRAGHGLRAGRRRAPRARRGPPARRRGAGAAGRRRSRARRRRLSPRGPRVARRARGRRPRRRRPERRRRRSSPPTTRAPRTPRAASHPARAPVCCRRCSTWPPSARWAPTPTASASPTRSGNGRSRDCAGPPVGRGAGESMIGLLVTLITVATTPAQVTRLSLPFEGIWGSSRGSTAGRTSATPRSRSTSSPRSRRRRPCPGAARR